MGIDSVKVGAMSESSLRATTRLLRRSRPLDKPLVRVDAFGEAPSSATASTSPSDGPACGLIANLSPRR